MARINRRPAGSQQRKQCRLWPLQTKGYLVVALCRHILEIGIPRFAGINAQLLGRLTGQQIPGAFDVIGSERLAVVPFDPLTQRESQLHAVLIPRPTRGQVRHDRLQAGCATSCLYMIRLLKTCIIGCSAARVDSSRIDMLAGLSKCESLRTPPCFWASAGLPPASAINIAPTVVKVRTSGSILFTLSPVITDLDSCGRYLSS